MNKNLTKVLRGAGVAMFLLLAGGSATAGELLPKPRKISYEGTPFALNRGVVVSDPTSNAQLARTLTRYGLVSAEGASAKVSVSIVSSIPGTRDYTLAGYPDEAYTLSVSENEIKITAITPVGVTRAAQTLAQLAEGEEAVSGVVITDWPAFKLRGFMHDVGRSFISVDALKRHIDILAGFKVNTFHWHLTENQAWRFEVKAYPQLTSASTMTRFPGKYYTQDECREIEEYAAERGIAVIPEIDMPGHSEAFERAMGHSMQTDQGVAELQVILEEVASVFKHAAYIHIGADEKGITYPNFLKIMTDKVHSLGKKVVVWNPISGVTINASSGFDMLTNWSTSGTKKAGMPNVDLRYNYINHFDVFADLVGIYRSNILYETEGNAEVAGSITGIWNDRKTPTENDIVLQNNFYANALATAERCWIGGGKQYIEKGGAVLPVSGEEFEEFASWEERFLWHKDRILAEEPVPYVKQTNVKWRVTEPFPNGGDSSMIFPPETEPTSTSYSYNGTTYNTIAAAGAGVYLRHTWGTTVPSIFANPQINNTCYAYTYIYSPTEQEAGALIEFQNYGRSEKDSAPDKGKWDRKGSRIWLNDQEIMPPVWTNSGKSITNEVDLGNENFTAREPMKIKLREGWNKVMIKLPYVSAGGVRLNKWMYTFVVTEPDGRHALPGIVYSPLRTLDAAAEDMKALIDTYNAERNTIVGTLPGFIDASAARDFDAVVEEIEASFEREMSPEEREAQKVRLAEAFASFKSSVSTAEINQPKEGVAYYLHTPGRANRYATSRGVGGGLMGDASPTEQSKWKFELRTDGSYDICNVSDGSYVSPSSATNTQLLTVANPPAAGWTVKRSDTIGNVIITSGSVEWNQTNAGLSYKIYNWGSGTNISDSGCKYRFDYADPQSGVSGIEAEEMRGTMVHDLMGRVYPTLESAPRGVLIVNGKKIFKTN